MHAEGSRKRRNETKDQGARRKVKNVMKDLARFKAEILNSNDNSTSSIIYAFY